MTRHVVYWLTKSIDDKHAIMRRFRIYGESVNGESEVFTVSDVEDALLIECARRGFLKIRNKYD